MPGSIENKLIQEARLSVIPRLLAWQYGEATGTNIVGNDTKRERRAHMISGGRDFHLNVDKRMW